MIYRAYSIYDRKALVYSQPLYAPNDQVALRIVQDTVADPNTSLGRHPGDYVLYYVGNFDDAKGILEPVAPLVHVVDLLALVPQQAQAPLFNDHQ